MYSTLNKLNNIDIMAGGKDCSFTIESWSSSTLLENKFEYYGPEVGE